MIVAFFLFFLLPEPLLLDVDLVQNTLESARSASNPAVLGHQVERIALSSISLFGLDGVTPNEVVFFDAGPTLVSSLKSHSFDKAGKTVLYIPKIFNYPKIDAVLVSHHPAQAIKASKAVPAAANAIANSSSTSTKPRKPVSSAHGFVHIQFIQISIGAIDSKKLQNTRSVLDAKSPERELWRHAAGVSAVNLKFSLRWLVSSDEVMKIQCCAAEKFSPLSSVHAALNL